MKIHLLTVPTVALALIAPGCGEDENEKGDTSASTPTAQEPVKPAPAQKPQEAADDPPAGGEDAVKKTILDWTFEGECDLMTDKFLEEQAFVGDTRAERCKYFEDSFQKPQYSESDVKFRKIQITGDKAVATVGSDIANIEADYHLVAEGGGWKIDEVDL